MIELLCPVCGQRLRRGEKTWNCDGGHAFDVARQGYVNLLPVTQKHSLHPGDTRQQVVARRAFLDRGFYLPIVRALAEETGAEVLQLHSMQNVTAEEFSGGETYVSLMQKNLEALKEGLK